MNKDLQNKLYDIDPIFFEKAIACENGTMNQMNTCMAFGCQCGDGWFEPIKKFVQKTHILNELGKQYNIKFVCEQLKEKFGEIRIYSSSYKIDENKEFETNFLKLVEMFNDALNTCERECSEVCEICGASGGYNNENIVQTSGWVSYICKKCSQKQIIEQTKRFDERNEQEYIPRITLFKQGFAFLNMFYRCHFYYNKTSYGSIIEAYICNKDIKHKHIYDMLSREKNSSYINYALFKQFGGQLLQEDYQLLKAITKARFTYVYNKNDLVDFLKTRGFLLKNMGKHCNNIYGFCVCDKCQNVEHKDLYGKILMQIREQLLNQNDKKQNDVCWKDGVYYLRNEKQQLVEKSRIDISNYQKEHNIKDQDIKILF